MTQNHKSGAGHVHANPYPDKMISGSDAGGPNTSKSVSGKKVSGGKPSTVTTRPSPFKK